MRKFILFLVAICCLITNVSAAEFTAPEVPEVGREYLREEPETFAEGLWSIVQTAITHIQPALAQATGMCVGVVAAVILLSVIRTLPGVPQRVVELVGALSLAALLLQPGHTMIRLGAQTVTQLSEYGKLLLPVMTAAVAAQGGVTTSAALYSATVVFDAFLCALISSIIVPLIYVFLCLATADCAVGDGMLGKLRDFFKWLMTWTLKTVLYVFIGYISITGVVSGSADAAAVKAAKLTISGVVPVVGGILSDASEAVLVSAGVMKSAVGVYGVLAILALWIGPFIEIGAQYLLLKLTGAICGVFGAKESVRLIQDFSSAMGMLLAMTGTVCLLLLISTVCFMKGVG